MAPDDIRTQLALLAIFRGFAVIVVTHLLQARIQRDYILRSSGLRQQLHLLREQPAIRILFECIDRRAQDFDRALLVAGSDQAPRGDEPNFGLLVELQRQQ